jgi:hypothetical protein
MRRYVQYLGALPFEDPVFEDFLFEDQTLAFLNSSYLNVITSVLKSNRLDFKSKMSTLYRGDCTVQIIC